MILLIGMLNLDIFDVFSLLAPQSSRFAISSSKSNGVVVGSETVEVVVSSVSTGSIVVLPLEPIVVDSGIQSGFFVNLLYTYNVIKFKSCYQYQDYYYFVMRNKHSQRPRHQLN